MSRFTHHFVAVAAALFIMAGSFGAVISVPPAQASDVAAAPALA
ncbi:hypothetical protein [Erythrobacter litoralis]|uniref:Uncharacterized protein n=1 Tax=Erythrobacter litoralis (strain HTCC2594) TaxID=314225 RepID=Q2N5Q9_ERYLH|nr:hypothetical protein [Erythrobacter litoralis]ABC64982.1 hypothetical protein ELI_14450 [Erythrobacter litoralis HTCC2594]